MNVSKRILMVRHGHANYEAAFSSEALTDDGITAAKEAGSQIAATIGEESVRVISSPEKRAVATAELICDEIAFPTHCIRLEPALASYHVYDRVKRDKEFFEQMVQVEKRVKDLHELDGLYLAGDPCWDAYPTLFEPRQSVASRVFRWLGHELQSFHDENVCDLQVAVTHAEVMNVILPAFGVTEPVRQGEILDLWIDISPDAGEVVVHSVFRDTRMSREFQVPSRAFGAQFGPWWR